VSPWLGFELCSDLHLYAARLEWQVTNQPFLR
jgi:hypothetical protein